MIFKKYTFWDLATYTKFSVQITSFCPHLHTYTWYSNSNAMTKRETKIREKQKPLSTTACTKKSVFVDTNRFRNGCFCTNMCKACTCFKVDLITTPVGALKIIELVRDYVHTLCFYFWPEKKITSNDHKLPPTEGLFC